MAKKKSKSKPKAKSTVIRPVRSTLSKSALIGRLAEENGLTRKQASGVFDSLEGALLGSIHPQGAGSFILPGLMKVTLRKVPARKAGTLVRNPGTGEMVKAAARPATVRVKIRPLKKLKTAATK
ncbi:MAG TPA: HU family DNA-binding protein [Alphaproteobacteria bacterium]|jgi:nucleoid DNA-binding protein|nr:HU family DNA-binding protein [Micavibrio sp.]MBK9561947.1 HU family DNA-binding protein [Micavibrio sp.]HQX27366.1 HU family DNA-binding protein [Alphaproteobacteria bacterium]